MPEREAFLRTIGERPDDDGPRLVFADWLEEQGDPLGEFIRSQCERLHLPTPEARRGLARREDELLQAHQREWRHSLPKIEAVQWGPFRRGFVYNLRVDTADRFLAHAATIFAAAPIDEVWFTGLNAAGAARLAASPELRRLRVLKNHGTPTGDEGVAALVMSPHVANLRRLLMNGNSIGSDGARAIARSPHLGRLTLLFLHHNRIGDAGARDLADSERLGSVEEVYLAANDIHEAAAMALRARWGERVYL